MPKPSAHESFGFDRENNSYADVLRLLCASPRLYAPLVEAWGHHFPQTRRVLRQLTDSGWVNHQDPIIANTKTSEIADHSTRPAAQYKATAAGHEMVVSCAGDERGLSTAFPKLTPQNASRVLLLLEGFDSTEAKNSGGISVGSLLQDIDLPRRTGFDWQQRFLAAGLIRSTGETRSQVREIVPAHWRITPALLRQLNQCVGQYPTAANTTLIRQCRVKRRMKLLPDIDPSRISAEGANDFEHDIRAQRLLATLLRSSTVLVDQTLAIEPTYRLKVQASATKFQFSDQGANFVTYRPDAEYFERNQYGQSARVILEFERHQTRAEAWRHIERFLGYVYLNTFAFQPVVLRFVVETSGRSRSYNDLVSGFKEYLADNPNRRPVNAVTISVASERELAKASDPLDPSLWSTYELSHHGLTVTTKPALLLSPPQRNVAYETYVLNGARA